MLFRQISINLTFKRISVSWENIMAGIPTRVNNTSRLAGAEPCCAETRRNKRVEGGRAQGSFDRLPRM